MNSELLDNYWLQHRQRLLALARKYVPSREDAEDVVQNAMLKSYRYYNPEKYNSTGGFNHWICMIVQHCAFTHQRLLKKHLHYLTPDDLENYNTPSKKDCYPSDVLPIFQELNRLPDAYKIPLELVKDGYSYEEIGHAIGKPIGSVKSSLWRARHALTTNLEKVA